MGTGPPVVFERSLEFKLAGMQRVAVLERLDAFVAVLVDHTEFKVAGWKLARFVPEQVVLPFEPPEHVLNDTAVERGSYSGRLLPDNTFDQLAPPLPDRYTDPLDPDKYMMRGS